VSVSIDGRPLPSYTQAFVVRGRAYATVAPLLASVADRVWFSGNTLIVERGERRVRVKLVLSRHDDFRYAVVAVGPILRALGDAVYFDRSRNVIDVRTPAAVPVVSPTPFDPATTPSQSPRTIFTPTPAVTPRPVWTGSPLPRRTPLPLGPPRRQRRSG
jgi:hypothetical protein